MKVHTKVWLALFLLSDVPYDICINVPNHVYLPWVNVHLAKCLNSVLNVKALISTFNQKKAQVRGLLLGNTFVWTFVTDS